MRPTPGVDPPAPRSRKSSSAGQQRSNSVVSSTTPTTFFLASESDVEKAMASGPSGPHGLHNSGSPHKISKPISRDSTYGVQSLEHTLDDAFGSKVDDRNVELEEGDGEGDMLYRLLRMRKKKAVATSAGKSPLVPTGEADQRRDESASDETTAHSAGASTPRSAARSTSPRLRLRRKPSQTTISQPLTPLMIESPTPFDSTCPSTPKSESMKSLKLSEEGDGIMEDTNSQAVVTSDEEDEASGAETGRKRDTLSTSALELVMPSLAMPRRRPFTARGRQMGRLKLCVAGLKGAGKSSLIRALVQHCEDIVHIDPVNTASPTSSKLQAETPRSRTKKRETGTQRITEISASTKAYPAWWSELEEGRVLRRRKSMEDTVLERNICIIDCPGYSPGTTEGPDEVTQYIKLLLHRNDCIPTLSDHDRLHLLTGNGGFQVDLVLFVFPPCGDLIAAIERFKRLSTLTTVIPVVGKADLLNTKALLERKKSILNAILSVQCKPFLFGRTTEEVLEALFTSTESSEGTSEAEASTTSSTTEAEEAIAEEPIAKEQQRRPPSSVVPPFAVSTVPGSDEQEMDASLLMSPSYNPPLLPSELQSLITQIFDPENISWFRHNAVRKYLAWRNRQGSVEGLSTGSDSTVMNGGALGIWKRPEPTASNQSSSQSLIARQSLPVNSPFNLSSTASRGAGLSDFTQARIRDHTLREETLAQVQLSRWAADLHHAMQQERDHFEGLMKGERAKWLLEKINEEVTSGNIGAVDTEGIMQRLPLPRASSDDSRKSGKHPSSSGWSLATSTRRPQHGDAELPSWARPKRKSKAHASRLNAEDPLGLCEMGDSVRRTSNTVIKVLGGSVIVTAVYFAVVGAIHRFTSGAQPQPPDFFPAWVPRWLSALLGRVAWPEEPQMWV